MENHLGANIKLFRKNKGYTQEELAGMLGVTPQAVSRWESEAGLPDVSMIVPIAQTLGITTDALLGYRQRSGDDRITEKVFAGLREFDLDVADPAQSALRACEFLADEVGKNPMNFDIVLKYVQRVAGLSYYIDMQGLLADDPKRAEGILDDGIRKGLNVIRYCNNTKKINKAHYALAWIYIHRKDFDNAREHVNVLPALEGHTIREEINQSVVFFEKGFETVKDTVAEFNRRLFDVLAQQIQTMTTYYCYNGTLEEVIELCSWCDAVIAAYSTKPEFTDPEVFPWLLKKYNFSKMSAYGRFGKSDEAKKVCEDFLTEARTKGLFSEEEYNSVEKEFHEGIYIL